MSPPKAPDLCQGLGDIREGIDDIDFQIIGLLKCRMAYVKAAARFKPTEASIPAPDRVASMLAERRTWAEQAGLPADGIASLFASLIQWFIDQQTRHWRAQRAMDGPGEVTR